MYQKNLAVPLGGMDGVEMICVRNQERQYTLPEALNIGARESSGELLLFCHHDIEASPEWLWRLKTQVKAIEQRDANWGVIGLMGVRQNGYFAGHVVDPHTAVQFGRLPCTVETLDELCLGMHRDRLLTFDEGLGGFHFYGADICLEARAQGRRCYALGASVVHRSAGKIDDGFSRLAHRMKEKWSNRPDAPRSIETTCGVFPLREGLWVSAEVGLKRLRRSVLRRLQGR